MKKFLSIILALLMLTSMISLASCKKADTDSNDTTAAQDVADDTTVADDETEANTTAADDTVSADSDLAYIKNNGEMIIGITLFAPMNYKDADGELIGFETEFAKAVCAKLGVTPNFQVIDWNSKELELNAKTIDCIWNGMTITPERQENMSISTPYMSNEQVIIVKEAYANDYTTAGSLDGMLVAAESGSAGQELIEGDEFFSGAEFVGTEDMAAALLEVKANLSEACVVDYITALGMIGEGTDYTDLVVVDGVEFAKEEYGIAFRKDSDVTEAVNAAIAELIADGTLAEIATKYNLETLLIG